MRRILEPLEEAGVHGFELASGDGAVRRGHPIFAAFVSDYPEQLLTTCCKNGECPKCTVLHNQLGERGPFPPRDLVKILDALDTVGEGATVYNKACADAGIKPVFQPFWENLPFVDIFCAITPDELHQLYQGMIKHVTLWITSAFGAAEIDARCRRMPPHHSLRLFSKGITTLSRVSGTEHHDMCRILLGLVIGIPLPGRLSSVRLVRAVRAILDFCYIVQYPSQTSETICQLDAALDRFHANKSIFIDLGIRTNFNIPKLHSMIHYPPSMERIGTSDNTNTEYTERLHIDLAKDAYQATNRKDEYPQMTKWLERKEKIQDHTNFVAWQDNGSPDIDILSVPQMERALEPVLARHPSVKACTVDTIQNTYGAVIFRQALADFIVSWKSPGLSRVQAARASAAISFPFRCLPVWHKIKFWSQDPLLTKFTSTMIDTVHVRPARINAGGRSVPGRFDTVLIGDGSGGDIGLAGKSMVFAFQKLL